MLLTALEALEAIGLMGGFGKSVVGKVGAGAVDDSFGQQEWSS